MISEFSSLLEFYAAIYVSMCLDNEVCKRFWSPDYYRNIEANLKMYPFSNQTTFFDNFISDIITVREELELCSRRKGAYLLSVCVLFLMYIGFEDDWSGLDNINEAICITLILTLVVSLLYKTLLRKWKSVLFWLVLQCVVVMIIGEIPALREEPFFCGISEALERNVKPIFLFSISFPILFQLFENWLYSGIYRSYISYNIQQEYNTYESSKKGIEQGIKESIDKAYLQAWNDSILVNKKSDVSLAGLNGVLFMRLKKLTHPNMVVLLVSLLASYKRHFVCMVKDKFNHKKEKAKNPIQQQQSSVNEYAGKKDFAKEYDEFCRHQSSSGMTVRAFCTQEKINLKDFIAWMRINKPKKKK